MKRALYITLGAICVALGALGVILPGLPTTPFILAASWLFYRSSPKLQRWLVSSHLGTYIRKYERQGGMSKKAKALVVLFMATMVVCSIIFFIPQPAIDLLVGLLGLIGCLTVLFLVPQATSE